MYVTSAPFIPSQSFVTASGQEIASGQAVPMQKALARTLKLSDFVKDEAKVGSQLTSTLYSPPLLSVSSYPWVASEVLSTILHSWRQLSEENKTKPSLVPSTVPIGLSTRT